MGLVVRVGRLSVFVVRLLWPIVWLSVRLTLRVVAFSIASLWIGVPTASDRIAVMWTTPLMGLRQLVHHEQSVYTIMRVISVAVMVMGWIIAAYVIVATLTIMQGLL